VSDSNSIVVIERTSLMVVAYQAAAVLGLEARVLPWSSLFLGMRAQRQEFQAGDHTHFRGRSL
jgi:hypothetical protein